MTRRILMLQGLSGPFFRYIGRALRQAGDVVYKIQFNGGDKLFWCLPNAVDYRGTPQEWPQFLSRFLRQKGITHVLLFGDCRPLHRMAVEVCRQHGVAVYVFEEGYLRPDWVTLEAGGVNGHSSLPRDPHWYVERARSLPPLPAHRPVLSSFRRRALEAIAYNCADVFTRWYFRHWQDYRPWHPWTEGKSWLRRLLRQKAAHKRTRSIVERLELGGTPYMLFPLQLDADAQVREHSPFGGMKEAIAHVLASFARHAPEELHLCCKEHPLDNGLTDWHSLITQLARQHGVARRVHYLERWDIAQLTARARGVVTINSTTGTLALAQGVAVVALGQAVYNLDGITHQGGLDTFWSAPTPPDAEIFAAFRRVLIDHCLIEGGFFSVEGLNKLVEGTLARLSRAEPPA